MVLQKFFGVLFIVSILTGIHGTDSIPKQVVDIAKIAVSDPIELKKGVPQCSPDKKMVFAHVVPWHILYNSQLRVDGYHEVALKPDQTMIESAKREIAMAQSIGIDGFFVDIGTADQASFADSYLEAAKGTSFLVGYCLDIKPLKGEEGIKLSVDSIEKIIKRVGSHPNFPKVGNKYVFFSFSGAWRHSPEKIAEVKKRLKAKGIEIYYILHRETPEWRANREKMIEGTYVDPYGEICDSFYQFMFSSRAWNDRGEPEGIHRKEFIALRNALNKFGKKPVATITPGYRGNWLEDLGHCGYVPFRGYDKIWDCFHAFYPNEVNWINISTWNDLGETPIFPRTFDYGASAEVIGAFIDQYFRENPAPEQSEPKVYFAANREYLAGTIIRLTALSAPVQIKGSVIISGRLLGNNGEELVKLQTKTLQMEDFDRCEWLIPSGPLAISHAIIPEITLTWNYNGKNNTSTRELPAILLRTPWIQNWSVQRTAFHNLTDVKADFKVTQNAEIVTAKLKFNSSEKIARAMLYRNDRMVADFTTDSQSKFLNLTIYPKKTAANFDLKIKNGRIIGLKREHGFNLDMEHVDWGPQHLRLQPYAMGSYGAQMDATPETIFEIYHNGKSVGSTTVAELLEKRNVAVGPNQECRIEFNDWNNHAVFIQNGLPNQTELTVNFYSRPMRESDIYHINFLTTDGKNAYTHFLSPFRKEKLVRMNLLETYFSQEATLDNMGYYVKVPRTNKVKTFKVSSNVLREGAWNFDNGDEDSLGDRPLTYPIKQLLKPEGPDGSKCLVFTSGSETMLRRRISPLANCVIEFSLFLDEIPQTPKLIMSGNGDVCQGGFFFKIQEDGKLRVGRYGDHNYVLSRDMLIPQKWYSIKFTFDEKKGILFIDGKKCGESDFKSYRDFRNRFFTLGDKKDGFEGKIDNLKFSNCTK